MEDDKEYYEAIARQHTGLRAVMHSSLLLAAYRHMLEWLVLRQHIKQADAACDLGCGNGRFFPLFLDNFKWIDGVDFSEELINQAKKKYCDSIDHYRISLKIQDSSRLSYNKNLFDAVFLILILPHDDKKTSDRTLREAARILKSGGQLFIIDEPDTQGSIWNKSTLITDLSNYNLKIVADKFIRSNLASSFFSNGRQNIQYININRKFEIQGNVFKDAIKILIDMWIDIPSVLFNRNGKEGVGFERLLIFKKK